MLSSDNGTMDVALQSDYGRRKENSRPQAGAGYSPLAILWWQAGVTTRPRIAFAFGRLAPLLR
jgi:hypothetical protein